MRTISWVKADILTLYDERRYHSKSKCAVRLHFLARTQPQAVLVLDPNWDFEHEHEFDAMDNGDQLGVSKFLANSATMQNPKFLANSATSKS